MHLRLRSSIVAVVMVGVLIPVSVSSYITLGRRQATLVESMQSNHQRMTNVLALGVQSALWNLDSAGAIPLLEALFGDLNVVTVEVVDGAKNRFLFKQEIERRTGSQYSLTQDVVFHGEGIGSVRIEVDSGEMDRQIAGDRLNFAWTALGQLLISLILIVALLQRRLLKPISRLIRDSKRLAERDLAQPLDWEDKDELGRLGVSLESTRRSLQFLFGEIESKNKTLEQDIQRRAVIERELEDHRNNLEALVSERTAELQAAKERADLANQAKSTFLSSMTHELRTPLNAILGYAQILKRDKGLTERQMTGINTIQHSGDHLLMLITDLLDLAKIESGKFELVPEPVNFPLFLSGIVDIVRVKADQKKLVFSYE
jgi:signal transduction histidine kinase